MVVSESRQRFLSDPYHKDRFTYAEQSDSFTCPQSQTLKFVRIQHTNGVPLRLYRASGAVCLACPVFGVCTSSRETGGSLAVGPNDEVLRRHRACMSTKTAMDAYKLRKQLVEPVFGINKEQQGARRFLLCGLANVAAEWTMLATAFNLRTLLAGALPPFHPSISRPGALSRFLNCGGDSDQPLRVNQSPALALQPRIV